MTFALISLLVGMVLGQRFKVLVLLPTIAVAVLVTTGTGLVHADSGWSIVMMAAATAASLQVGYLAGVTIRHMLAVARASKLPATSLRGSSPARRPAH
jgi:hypothetical protein